MLSSFKTYLINLDEQPDRLVNSKNVLEKINQPFSRFSGIKHSVGIIGCGMSHLEVLKMSKSWTLILEDDIALTDFPKRLGEIPKNTDAIYLGVSTFGYIRGLSYPLRNSVLVTQVSEDYKRVFNMCATHAILYLSERYIEESKKLTEYCLSVNIPWDLGIASIHRHFNILTPNNPWFYQSEQSEVTNFSLKF